MAAPTEKRDKFFVTTGDIFKPYEIIGIAYGTKEGTKMMFGDISPTKIVYGAINSMISNAKSMNAHGIIGMRLAYSDYKGNGDFLSAVAYGTAIKIVPDN